MKYMMHILKHMLICEIFAIYNTFPVKLYLYYYVIHANIYTNSSRWCI